MFDVFFTDFFFWDKSLVLDFICHNIISNSSQLEKCYDYEYEAKGNGLSSLMIMEP